MKTEKQSLKRPRNKEDDQQNYKKPKQGSFFCVSLKYYRSVVFIVKEFGFCNQLI